MISSTAPTLSRAGRARLEVELVDGRSTVTSAFASNPCKLLIPRSRATSVWAYLSSFGGGLLAGDQTSLEVRIGAGARCFFSTQAATKVYRNPEGRPCQHRTRAVVEEHGLLVFAPDPVQPFAGSIYRQEQEWHVGAGAGLVLLDWFCSGRMARGEQWHFSQFKSRNDVYLQGERVFVDSIALEGARLAQSSSHAVGAFHCFAMLLFIGERCRPFREALLASVEERPVALADHVLCSASPIAQGAVLRVAGERSQHVAETLEAYLGELQTQLGDNPWARKW